MHILGWNRQTLGKALHELASGITCLDACAVRRRKRAEVQLPNVLTDSQALVDSQRQADSHLRTSCRSTRLTAAEVRQQLISQKGSTDAV